MATVFGVNALAAQSGTKSPPGTQNGHIKNHYDEYTFAGAVFAVGDVINLGKMPKGAKVKSASIYLSGTLGASGTFKLGYAATAKDATDRTAEIVAATAMQAGGYFHANMLNDALAEEKDIIMTCTVATTAATGVKAKVGINFIVD